MSDLTTIQKWFHTVVTHADGVAAGVESDAASQHIALTRDELEQIVTRSNHRTAEQRLHVYANAYYARLLECLGETFPVLKRALGEETFNGFAFGYLQRYPSRSYTLNEMGDRFAQYLQETRPDRPEDDSPPPVGWPDLLIDLARFEWTIAQVFDGPGIERMPLLSSDDLASIAPDDWPNVRLRTAPCLQLLAMRFPVNDYYTAVRNTSDDSQLPPPPDPADTWVAITRRDWIVRRYPLSRPQYELLAALQAGESVGQAIERAAEHLTDLSDADFAEALQAWFRQWTAGALFVSVERD